MDTTINKTAERWYAKATGCSGQALVIGEVTGANIAVVYEEKNAALLAAAPELAAFVAKCEEWLDGLQEDFTGDRCADLGIYDRQREARELLSQIYSD